MRFQTFGACSSSRPLPSQGGEPGLIPKGVSSWESIFFLKGLILAQNERWRRGLGMQVERIPAFHSGQLAAAVGSKKTAECRLLLRTVEGWGKWRKGQ